MNKIQINIKLLLNVEKKTIFVTKFNSLKIMKKLLLFISVFAVALSVHAQNSLFKIVENSFSTNKKVVRDAEPTKFSIYSLDYNAIKAVLRTSPRRTATAVSNVIVSFPNSEGEMQRFKMYESSTLEEGIAATCPNINSYVGKCIEDPTATITITTTIFGLHTVTHSAKNGTTYIDPYTKDLQNYIVYNKSHALTTKNRVCNTKDSGLSNIPEAENLSRPNNSLWKVYRLALACTIEYADFHVQAAGLSSGTLAQKKDAVLAAMVVTIARVNSVYERDLSVKLVIINDNRNIINITSDTLDNENTNNALLNQIQAFIDGIISPNDYDLGHVASTGGGGVATLGSLCGPLKAQGVTGLSAPVGDPYDIDYVAHEIGHQFGGEHTFNSEAGSCGSGNRTASSSFEPGSGTTIQSYSGICAPENVQLISDTYYHARTLIQANNVINGINGAVNCVPGIPSGNTASVITAMTTSTIPFGTAFVLTGQATDIDNPTGDQLSYCWEQYNAGLISELPNATKTAGPNFRSFSPSVSPTRYFPSFATVLTNNLVSTWEAIPNVSRLMLFSLVVRDNGGPLGGQTQRATKNVLVANVGPFKVTSQSVTEGWAQGSTQTVTWDVAGTTANGINTALVNIKITTDGGATFTTLLANTPNDGSETVTAPNIVTQNARLVIEAVGNVFYAVNRAPIFIGYSIVNTCVTYTNSTPFSIPDGSTSYTQRTINVPTSAIITDVNVSVNVTHPNLENLNIAVLRPGAGAQLLNIYNRNCSNNANINVKFDMQAPAFVCGSPVAGVQALPISTSSFPIGDLNTYNGLNAIGDWRFGFRDLVATNTGTVNSFAIEICSQTVSLLSSESFNFENFAIYPNPNNGNFTVKFDSGSNSKISIIVNDLSGRKVSEKIYSNSGFFNENIKLENVQAGIYLVTVKDGEKQIVKKIVVE